MESLREIFFTTEARRARRELRKSLRLVEASMERFCYGGIFTVFPASFWRRMRQLSRQSNKVNNRKNKETQKS